MNEGPVDAYRARLAGHRAAAERARSAGDRMAATRIATFVLAFAGYVAWDVLEGPAAAWAAGAGVFLLLAFVAEVAVHRRLRRQERWHASLASLAAEGVHRIERSWPALAEALPPAEAAAPQVGADHPFADDLDVTGPASLWRLMGPVTTGAGRRILGDWLLGEEAWEEVPARQAAVKELAGLLDLRMTFAAHGRARPRQGDADLHGLLAWAEGAPWLRGAPAWRLAAWIVPAALWGCVLGTVLAGWPPLWVAPAVIQAVLLRRVTRRVAADLRAVEEGSASLAAWIPQMRLVEGQSWRSPLLSAAREALRGVEGGPASQALALLERRADTVRSRRNMVYGALAVAVLADLHLAAALDRWRIGHGARVRTWLDALGRWEALAALATLAHDHPDWCFPVPRGSGEAAEVDGEGLGHPLLPPQDCVRNDVRVGPPGSFVLVTGSNMSGKSTLLRAVGLNVVLAGAGGPCCARALSLPRLRVRTVMRVEDSLARGISLFMAELLRIRAVVDAAAEEGPPVLFLLDEMLHGTNTAERRVAARAVLRHLLSRGAIGMVSTHDLELAEDDALAGAAVEVHFRETVRAGEDGETVLDFDYRLRPGRATTRNALLLLEAVGLG